MPHVTAFTRLRRRLPWRVPQTVDGPGVLVECDPVTIATKPLETQTFIGQRSRSQGVTCVTLPTLGERRRDFFQQPLLLAFIAR
jgi:hypothetical protein